MSIPFADFDLILTANRRLSRTLRLAFDQQQASAGRRAWPSPEILPLGSWLRARWSDALLSGAGPPLALLSPSQEEAVWRRIVASSPDAASLLDLRGAARSAKQAWRLIHQYRLAIDGRFDAHEDCAAFASWARQYRDACDWMDEARLPDAIREIAGPATRVLLAGFDEFTPQQERLFAAMNCSALEQEAVQPDIARCGCADAAAEMRSAAIWARDRAARGERTGVVVLGLNLGRSALERIFGEELPGSFHISIPNPLTYYPLVNAALLALGLAARDRWALADAESFLSSPFFAGSDIEAPARSMVEARLRRRRRAYVATESIAQSAVACPALLPILDAWRAFPAAWRRNRLPSAWTLAFRDALAAAGWPGDRVLSSSEYQVFEAWQALLVGFASLDAAAGAMSCEEALTRLTELAGDTGFQPQDPGAPVQIMGALEAAGARFDALWIAGATAETWPSPAHPHPFLPLSLQRDNRLPHSSPAREWEFAGRTFARLRESAPRVVVSWPRRAGDADLRPSPLLAALHEIPAPTTKRARAPIAMERIVDEKAPPLDNSQPGGGTRVIERQSACPFQAFAYVRLNAQPLESADLGLSAADRGSAIHEALRLFWESAGDYAALAAMDEPALRAAASNAVDTALRKPFRDSSHAFDREFRRLETERLTRILVDWAGLEMTRAPFRVAFSERERVIRIAGLELAARVDRVDELPDGRQVILDYKTTAPSPAAWSGERPEDPQLPLYAISNESPVAALAFAQIGPEGLRFKGLAANDGILPGVRAFPESAQTQIAEWRRTLEPIARSFVQGDAAVDPRDAGAPCDLCRLTPLCRIHEDVPPDA